MPTGPEGPAILPEPQEKVLALHAEEIAIARRMAPRAIVRISKVTRTREQAVHETVARERVEVERVPIGAYVDVAPPVRQDGDVTVLSVVEEVLVTERRLLLKEEVRIRRVRTTEDHVETVTLRAEEAVVERIPVHDAIA